MIPCSTLLTTLWACSRPVPLERTLDTGTPRSTETEPTQPDVTGPAVPVFAFDKWALVDAADDPWSDHRPADVACDGRGFHQEGEALETETGLCNYATASTTTLVDIGVGDPLALLFWHNNLASLEPDASGHVALTLGEALLWELEVPIPHEPAVYEVSLTSPVDAPPGTELTYHVHNHGTNSWRLGMLTARARSR